MSRVRFPRRSRRQLLVAPPVGTNHWNAQRIKDTLNARRAATGYDESAKIRPVPLISISSITGYQDSARPTGHIVKGNPMTRLGYGPRRPPPACGTVSTASTRVGGVGSIADTVGRGKKLAPPAVVADEPS